MCRDIVFCSSRSSVSSLPALGCNRKAAPAALRPPAAPRISIIKPEMGR